MVRLLHIDGNVLSVVGLDCLDNTPLLDIKPYFASTDAVPDAKVGWHADRKRWAASGHDPKKRALGLDPRVEPGLSK